MIDVSTSAKDLSRLKADVSVCFAYSGDSAPAGVSDRRLRDELASAMKAERFKGNEGDRLVWNTDGRYRSRRFLIVGLGKRGGEPGSGIRTGCAGAMQQAIRMQAASVGLRLPPVGREELAAEVRAAAEGAVLGSYRYDRFLTDPDRKPSRIGKVEISSDGSRPAVRKAADLGREGAGAVCLARDLVNEPPGNLTPKAMAARAVKEARGCGLTARVLAPAELKKLGMRALLAVGAGSVATPRVVHLVYRPAKPASRKKRKIVLAGKGVTFDSGGLHIKPYGFMEDMKADMAGAAAVLGAMTCLKAVGCRAEVHGLLGLVENMPGSRAYKPGDILETFSGRTVEVGNTDAEGRLVLCDLLAYAARRLKPDMVVDVATLTGAVVVALGVLASGVFSRHDDLSRGILDGGRAGGEKLWPMPLYDEYLEDLKKGPADLRNVTAGRYGGAITAALFLGEFVPRELPWAHIDIAGPAFSDKTTAHSPEGGTGAGVRALVRWLEKV